MTTATKAEFTMAHQYQTDRQGPVRWIFSHAIRHWPLWILNIGGAFGNAALAAVAPFLIGQAFNAVSANPPDTGQLPRLALLLVITQLIRGGLHFCRSFGAEWLAQKMERNVRDELYLNLLGKSMTFHNLQPVGDTMARATNDVREVNYMFSPGMSLVIGSLSFLIMPLVVAPRINPVLALTPAVFIVVYVFALRQYLGSLHRVTDEVRGSFGQLNTRLAESLDGIETVKGASQETTEVNQFLINARRYKDASVSQGDIEARFLPLLLYIAILSLGLLHSLFLFREGILNIGQVISYFGTLLLLDFPTWTSMWAYSQISLGLAGARRILELMNRETKLDQNATGYSGKMRGEIEFRNVTFAYENQEPILENLTFKIQPGQTVAIVGQTGAGKTSLAKLVNRTYDVRSGHIMVDGVDVRDWNLEALRQQISIIEQDIFLFSRTIAENIAFGKPEASQNDIFQAAQAAQADEFIASFGEGYQTIIGERGVTLSGGQRQRLALARAFLTDPRILVLDDSTSAIDSATEDKIQRAIFNAAKGRTTLIITHRLSQIRWADLIIVLKQGNVAAIGNHDDLLRTSEAYRRIFND
ncbi:MAG: ABC transporter ATP-binding protein [Anaerolineaceae bacterium]|nr:ABC transporter ATP-binding protein [Anaerolineaceae bacterium]